MQEVKLFNNEEIRSYYDETKEEYYFSVIDVIKVLTEKDYNLSRKYWNLLKLRLSEEGSQLVSFCNQLKLKASDGKMRLTDCLATKDVFRLIEEIPSKKAEPFKMWLAQLGKERIDEIYDPEKAINRAISYYRNKGYDDEWITNRLLSIKARNELTDEWKERGITKPYEYAILTNELTRAWSNLTVKEYKNLKGLTLENLRDNMSEIELLINKLAELSTKNISKKEEPNTFKENIDVVKKGGTIAKEAKESYEKHSGIKVVTSKNSNDFKNKKIK